MKLKLQVAKWIVRRNEKRSRAARRALRDRQRLEWSRIRHDERRTRGLRLYIAWMQRAMAGRRFGEKALSGTPAREVRAVPPSPIIVPQPVL